MTRSSESKSLIFLSLMAAVLLSLLPLPEVLMPFKPYWVAMVVIYWSLEIHGVISLGLAFLIGVVVDTLSGSLMGLHALSLVVMVFLVQRFRSRLRFFPPWQQALSVFALLMNDRIILLWIITLRGDPLPSLGFWLPPVVGTLLWLPVFLLLDRFRSTLRRRAASR